MTNILRAEGIIKSFYLMGQKRVILRDLDFEMDDGMFVSLIGPSGCGKSTLLELLAGITKPDRGEIFYRGEQITGQTGLLGYMPQDDLLLPWLDVVDNALLPARVKGRNIREERTRVRKLLPEFGLEEHATHLPYQLSGGLKQRTAFLRTYLTDTQLLLLDEPFAGLDAISRSHMQDWLKVMVSKLKLSVILVTHDINEAMKLSDRICVMSSQPGSIIKVLELDRERGRDDGYLNEMRLELTKSVRDERLF